MKKYQRVDEQGRLDILKLYNEGENMIKLSIKFKITASRIYQILRECEALGHKINFRKK